LKRQTTDDNPFADKNDDDEEDEDDEDEDDSYESDITEILGQMKRQKRRR
jgi:hypothetical protein